MQDQFRVAYELRCQKSYHPVANHCYSQIHTTCHPQDRMLFTRTASIHNNADIQGNDNLRTSVANPVQPENIHKQIQDPCSTERRTKA